MNSSDEEYDSSTEHQLEFLDLDRSIHQSELPIPFPVPSYSGEARAAQNALEGLNTLLDTLTDIHDTMAPTKPEHARGYVPPRNYPEGEASETAQEHLQEETTETAHSEEPVMLTITQLQGMLDVSMNEAVRIVQQKLEAGKGKATVYSNVEYLKTEKIASPDKFDGNQRKVRPWLMQLDMKWKGNEERFPTEESKINYAYSFMRDRALDWAAPYIEGKDGYTIENTTQFQEQIQLAFGDPNPKATAEQRL